MINYAMILLCFTGLAICQALFERIKDGVDKELVLNWDLLKHCKSRFTEWLVRMPFSFIRDFEHLIKSTGITLMLTAFVWVTSQGWYMVIVYYTVIGVVFNLAYSNSNDINLTDEIL